MRYYNIGLCVEDNRVRGESGAAKEKLRKAEILSWGGRHTAGGNGKQ